MVVISIKGADGDGFLYETTTKTSNQELIESLVEIQNLRLRSRVIVDSVRGLAQYGPMKVKEANDCSTSIDMDQIDQGSTSDINIDPTGMRIGIPPSNENIRKTLLQTAQDLEDYVDKAQVKNRIALNKPILEDKIANVRGAVVMAYPMGLPEFDVVKVSIDGESLDGTYVSNELLDPKTTSLWCAGKEFERNQIVADRLGRNEKTKVIAKLQKAGSGPPSREPIVNEEERKAMMAHYFKRNEELKKLAEADDDDYLNSNWADSKEMKRNMQGLSHIQAPGL